MSVSEKSMKMMKSETLPLILNSNTYMMSRIPYVPFICLLNAGVCGCFYGLSTIMYAYLSGPSLGFSTTFSTSLTSMFFFLTYAFALVGGIVADAVTGPFKVILIGCTFMLVGVLTIVCSELFSVYDSSIRVPMSLIGITIFYLSNGFLKPCLSAFLGDQFLDSEADLRSKWFSWFYLTIQFGSLGFSIGTPISLQEMKPYITFVIILTPLLFGVSAFIIPHENYHKKQRGGNVFLTFIRILFTGCLGERQTNDRHWLDKAKSRFSEGEVEDAKAALKVLLVMVPLPFFWMIFFQMYSVWVKQASKMDTNLWGYNLPPSITSALNGLIDIFLIPLFEQLIYPFLARPQISRFFKFTPLRRMAAGHLFTIAALCVAGVVTKMATDRPGQIHIAFIIPQYLLISCGEILLSITGLEFAYKEAPASMKGTMTAVYLSTTAVGNALISALAFVDLELWIQDFGMAVIIAIVFCVFTVIAYFYTYKEDRMDTVYYE